jgi:hypothetical protein
MKFPVQTSIFSPSPEFPAVFLKRHPFSAPVQLLLLSAQFKGLPPSGIGKNLTSLWIFKGLEK